MFRRLSRSTRDYERVYAGSRSEYDHGYCRYRLGLDSGSLSAGYSGGSFEDGIPSSQYGRRSSADYSDDRDGRFEYGQSRESSSRDRSYMNPVHEHSGFDDGYSGLRYGRENMRDVSEPRHRGSRGSFDEDRQFSDRDSYDSRPGSSGYGSSRFSRGSFDDDDRYEDRRSYGGSSRYLNPPYEDDYLSRSPSDYGRQASSSPDPVYSDRDSYRSSRLSDMGSPGGYGSRSASILSDRASYGGSVESGRGPSGRYYGWPAPYPESNQGGSPEPDPSVYPHDGNNYLYGYRGLLERPRR